MTEVKATTAKLELRTLKLTKGLLKQFRKLRSIPEKFRVKQQDSSDWTFDPKYLVGWFHGSVLNDEYGCFLLFQDDTGDCYLYSWPGFGNEAKNYGGAKQIYIG